jgi:hypothetical protein
MYGQVYNPGSQPAVVQQQQYNPSYQGKFVSLLPMRELVAILEICVSFLLQLVDYDPVYCLLSKSLFRFYNHRIQHPG